MNVRISLMGTTLLLALVAAPAQSSTVCVNPNSASCEATIQDGIDAAVAGDTVRIASGFYNENVTIPVTHDGLTLRGGRGAILDPDDPLTGVGVTVNANDVTIHGFTIRNGDDYGLELNGTGATVRNMYISGPEGTCIYVNNDDATIANNRIRGCGGEAIYVDADNVDIFGNKISQCDNDCISINGDGFVVERNNVLITEDSYLITFSGDDGEIVNNRLQNADSQGIDGNGDNALIHGNRIMNTYGAIDHSGANPIVTRNRGRYFHGDDGLDVSCNTDCTTAEVSNNRIEDVADDSEGMDISADAPGLMFRNNLVRRVEDTGMDIDGSGMIIAYRNQVITNGGDSGEHCFDISGTGAHEIRDNRGADCHGDGINVSGTGHDIHDNNLRDMIEDGIHVNSGTNVLVEFNNIRNIHGVGIEVEGSTGTSVDGNRIRNVRMGICDEATGTVIGTNSTSGADTADQLNTAGICPID